MAKRLTEHVTSSWVGAANRMAPRKAKRRIIAYVESYDDISFWRNLFNDYETSTCVFQVMLPSSSSLAKGKKMALMNALGDSGLGENMIACVDSDYDYLMQGTTRLSRRIINNPFIFHTYTYAIENYQCYAGSLHEVCVQATLNDRQLIDFQDFLEQYSRIVYPLFLWSVLFYRHHDLNTFPLTDFCAIVRIHRFNIKEPKACLRNMERDVRQKLSELSQKHSSLSEQLPGLAKELEQLGVTPDTTYLFIQGHHLMDNVVLKILAPVCTQLRRERENEIKALAGHSIQYRNELTCYQNSQCSVELMLKKNTNYKDSYLYRKLCADVEHFLKRIASSKKDIRHRHCTNLPSRKQYYKLPAGNSAKGRK